MLFLYFGIAFTIGVSVQAQRICFNFPGLDTCPPGYRCQNGQCRPNNGGTLCTYPWDCSQNERCENGICVPRRTICRYPWDCSENEQCVNRRCVPRNPICYSNTDCLPNERCENGICVPRNPICISPLDCSPNERCENGICVSHGEFCTFPWDCSQNKECVNGICVSRDKICIHHWDCSQNERCVDGKCRPRFCTTDYECYPGGRCRLERCVYNSSRECQSDEDCPFGSCIRGKCQDSPTYCFPYTTRPCPQGYRCREGLCERYGPTQPGTCRSDRQCRYPNRCIGGYCVPRIIIG